MAEYVTPQAEIHQLFREVPVSLAQSQVPFVFGPNYLLHRYSEDAEKQGTFIGVYPNNTTFEYPASVLTTAAVDTGYTKLFGDDVFVKLVDLASATFVETGAGEAKKKVPNQLVLTAKSGEATALLEVSAGRVVYLVAGAGESAVKTPVVVTKVLNATTESVTVEIDEELDTDMTFTEVTICEVQQGVEFPRNDITDPNRTAKFWTESANGKGITVTALKAKIVDPDYSGETKYGDVVAADLYLTTRELSTAKSDAIHTITSVSDVTEALGTVHPDNPLAQAVYNAALNAGGQTVRYMAVASDTFEGYSDVLKVTTLTKEVYIMVPATRDDAIINLVQGHVNEMSHERVKRWRIAFISAKVPVEDPIYTAAASTTGSDFHTIVTKASTATDKLAEVQFVTKEGESWIADKSVRCKKDLKVGDIFVTDFNNEDWGVKVPHRFRIVEILSPNKLRVEDAKSYLKATTNVGAKAEAYHPFTDTEKATQVRNISRHFADRRVYNVFPPEFVGNGVHQTGEFGAACVAGLVASCLPQQPVTNLELKGIDDIPLVYQTFSVAELNTMASGGTFIVMQDLPNDKVYVRHQISTAYANGNLNTSELSITKNLDSISYFFDTLTSPYIGKYNITPDLLAVLRNVIESGIVRLASDEYGLYGAQLILDGTEIVKLEQDSLLKDHVECLLQLNMPYPFNHLTLKLYV